MFICLQPCLSCFVLWGTITLSFSASAPHSLLRLCHSGTCNIWRLYLQEPTLPQYKVHTSTSEHRCSPPGSPKTATCLECVQDFYSIRQETRKSPDSIDLTNGNASQNSNTCREKTKEESNSLEDWSKLVMASVFSVTVKNQLVVGYSSSSPLSWKRSRTQVLCMGWESI